MKVSVSKDLAPQRTAAVNQINAFAETVRLRFVTAGAAMQQVYRQKVEEATGIAADVDAGRTPDPAAYPLLSAEIGTTAPTLEEISQIVLNLQSLWAEIAAQIETIRYACQTAVTAAGNPAAIAAAVAASTAQLDALNPNGTPP